MHVLRCVLSSSLGLLVACSSTSSDNDGSSFGTDSATGGTTAATESTSSATTATGTGTTTAATGTATNPIFDVGNATGTTSGTTGSTVCQHVDAIFAFDVSGSMSGEIEAMADSMLFQTFRDTLLDAGNGLADFQLAVMDDAPAFPYYHDNTGALDNQACNFSTNANFMTSLSPNFDAEYACVFQNAMTQTHVGTYGGVEQTMPLGPNLDYLQGGAEMPARSSAWSVAHPMALQANDGFLRSDSVLFVLTISDEDDEVFVDGQLVKDPPMSEVTSQMTEIHDMLVSAKGGDPKKVVFLGIGAGSDGCIGPLGDTIREAEHLKFLVSLFEADGQGLFHDLCTGNLEDSILAALQIVDQSCDDFTPEG